MADNRKMKRGYHLIDPDLRSTLECKLSDDDRVRILFHLIGIIDRFMPDAECLTFRIIPCQYLGEPYPVMGLQTKDESAPQSGLTAECLQAGNRMNAYLAETGMATVLDRSTPPPDSWEQILRKSGRLP